MPDPIVVLLQHLKQHVGMDTWVPLNPFLKMMVSPNKMSIRVKNLFPLPTDNGHYKSLEPALHLAYYHSDFQWKGRGRTWVCFCASEGAIPDITDSSSRFVGDALDELLNSMHSTEPATAGVGGRDQSNTASEIEDENQNQEKSKDLVLSMVTDCSSFETNHDGTAVLKSQNKCIDYNPKKGTLVVSEGDGQMEFELHNPSKSVFFLKRSELKAKISDFIKKISALAYCANCSSFCPTFKRNVCDTCAVQELEDKCEYLTDILDTLRKENERNNERADRFQASYNRVKNTHHVTVKRNTERMQAMKEEKKALLEQLREKEKKLEKAMKNVGDSSIANEENVTKTQDTLNVPTILHNSDNLKKLDSNVIQEILKKVASGEVDCGITSQKLKQFSELAAAQFAYWELVERKGKANGMRWSKPVLDYTLMLAERIGMNGLDTLRSMVMLPSIATIYSYKAEKESSGAGVHTEKISNIEHARKKLCTEGQLLPEGSESAR